jgi:hypothetical protein
MCLRDVMAVLRTKNLEVTEAQIRWAITSGKVSRPSLDGSLRFDFRDRHLEELLSYFASNKLSIPRGS